MRFFGRKFDAPVYETGDWMPHPEGVKCWFCERLIDVGDDGFLLGGAEAMHRMCLLRAVLGPRADDLIAACRPLEPQPEPGGVCSAHGNYVGTTCPTCYRDSVRF